PGRHTNSNFVLSEFELSVAPVDDSARQVTIRFVRAVADYSQKSYEIAKAIDGAAGNSGWAVDGPTRKKPATAMFVAAQPFGFKAGTLLRFRLRHEANFGTHGIGRPRLSVTQDDPTTLSLGGMDADLRAIVVQPPARRSPAQWQRLIQHYGQVDPGRKAIAANIATLQSRKTTAAPLTLVMADMPKPRTTHVLHRGQYDQKREVVHAGVPAVFPALPKGMKADRLAFARWLSSREHPLTARVAVNRYWQRLFGTGIVKTSEDFGRQSEWPSHMNLLDWLAVQFMDSGWNVKEIQKLMVMSATYRQASRVSAEAWIQDPANRLLARGPRIRLDAEVIRDSALFASGLLIDRRGGPPVYPYQPKGLWLEVNNRPNYSRSYPHQTDPQQLYRRSIYTYWKRTVPPPAMAIFDAPEREFCVVRRSRTNTPLQAFVLLNGPQFIEAARVLGRRMASQGGASAEQRLGYGFRLVTSRLPDEREMAVLTSAYVEHLEKYREDPAAAGKVLSSGQNPGPRGTDLAEQAALTTVARLLLNLSETITKS
ncbi:MAG: DUF1553 domain-containing protein, partial [Phycisphaerae bacterium]|nr:DUF1553 domain-containing protein [Phycisphaerae bacterium]